MQLVIGTYERFLLGYKLPEDLQVGLYISSAAATPVTQLQCLSQVSDAFTLVLSLCIAGRMPVTTIIHPCSSPGTRYAAGLPHHSVVAVCLSLLLSTHILQQSFIRCHRTTSPVLWWPGSREASRWGTVSMRLHNTAATSTIPLAAPNQHIASPYLFQSVET